MMAKSRPDPDFRSVSSMAVGRIVNPYPADRRLTDSEGGITMTGSPVKIHTPVKIH